MTSRQEVYIVDIAMARIGDAAHADPKSTDRLLAADAEQRHWLGWSLEAKFAAWGSCVPRGNRAVDCAAI